MSQYPFHVPPFAPAGPCIVCKCKSTGASFSSIGNKKGLCGVCNYLIPSHIPETQYKKYISSTLYYKYNHTVSYTPDSKMSKHSSDFMVEIVAAILSRNPQAPTIYHPDPI